MTKYSKHLFLFFALLLSVGAFAQKKPVTWHFKSIDLGNGQADLVLTATIAEGWYTYSQTLESDMGPIPTTIEFKPGAHYKLVGKAKESGERFTMYDEVFDMKLTKFKHTAIFTQRVEVLDYSKSIEGYINYMVCDSKECLPPSDAEFNISITKKSDAPATTPSGTPPVTNGAVEVPNNTSVTTNPITPTGSDTNQVATVNTGAAAVAGNFTPPTNDPNYKGNFSSKRDIDSQKYAGQCSTGENETEDSLLWIFLAGFAWGLGAVLTPCIFPMIPVTVGFFVKRSKDRATGLRNAFLYGFSIWAIYVALGVGITLAFGEQALNNMSTNVWFNLVFFLVFLIFAISFFGAFEITLPSSWVNASDRMAGKGGLLGIFFMAFTLALVSFSCTGPLVGTLLVEAVRGNSGMILGFLPARPFVGLSGFGLALALPFALFAMFPSWLKSLPKSGGWMDNVKITLGFVELALAFKFLSTADMVMHWGILKFELFMAIWLICALMLALYQFGLLGWKGAKGKMGMGRLITGGLSALFAGYLAYGLYTFKPLSLLSGLAPPVGYSWLHPSDCPQSIDCYHDFDEALAVAKLENKPLFVDFTGYGCVNCRKMEENVWPLPGIIERLRNDYVVVSLYVDDKQRLFPDDKFDYLFDLGTGDKIRSVGDKWSSFQVNNFDKLSQPWYVLMSNDGKTILNEPRGYTPDDKEYKTFLDCGLSTFESLKNGNTQPKEVLGQR
jgi:thiol:disulfide interchange protein